MNQLLPSADAGIFLSAAILAANSHVALLQTVINSIGCCVAAI
jgi:hypothetical protein